MGEDFAEVVSTSEVKACEGTQSSSVLSYSATDW